MHPPKKDDLVHLLASLTASILVIDKESGFVAYANEKVCQDLGRPVREIRGKHIRYIYWPEFISIYNRILAECEDDHEHCYIYYWSEKMAWEKISAKSITWDGRPALLLTVTFVNEFTQSGYILEAMKYVDDLLKLPNGTKLEEDINALASLETVALLYFEIERFEEINDLYGWDSGDLLLMQVRDWLLLSEPNRAQAYRVNNGFALLGRHVTMQDATDRSEQILKRFNSPWELRSLGNELSIYCTVKLGVVYGHYVKNEMRNILLRTIRPLHQLYGYYRQPVGKGEKGRSNQRQRS